METPHMSTFWLIMGLLTVQWILGKKVIQPECVSGRSGTVNALSHHKDCFRNYTFLKSGLICSTLQMCAHSVPHRSHDIKKCLTVKFTAGHQSDPHETTVNSCETAETHSNNGGISNECHSCFLVCGFLSQQETNFVPEEIEGWKNAGEKIWRVWGNIFAGETTTVVVVAMFISGQSVIGRVFTASPISISSSCSSTEVAPKKYHGLCTTFAHWKAVEDVIFICMLSMHRELL